MKLVQRYLQDRDIPRAIFTGIDNCSGTRGISLLEVIHKLISKIITLRIAYLISFYKQVHGFQKKRGTFATIEETKVRIHITICASETLYQVYLNLRKVHDSIYRDR